jgi:hypothetical protein
MAAKLKIEKRGDEIKKKIFSSETTEPAQWFLWRRFFF